jgi:hypothetical protein
LAKNLDTDIEDKNFKSRLISIGPDVLMRSINEASAYYARGGANVWGVGILNAVNKGLRNKYKLNVVPEE